MKKTLLILLALAMVVSLGAVLVACGDDDGGGETRYTVTATIDEGSKAGIRGISFENTRNTKEDGTPEYNSGDKLKFVLYLESGYSIDGATIQLDGQNLTATTQPDNYADPSYEYDTNIAVKKNMSLTINGIARKVFNVVLPAASTLPDGATSVYIKRIFKDGAEAAVAANVNTIINYNDSICIAVTLNSGKTLDTMAGNAQTCLTYNGLSYTGESVKNQIYYSDIVGNEALFYVRDITRDMTLSVEGWNSTTQQFCASITYDKQLSIKLNSYGAGTMSGYDPTTHQTSIFSDLYVSFGGSITFTLQKDDRAADGDFVDKFDYENVQFKLNGVAKQVTTQTDNYQETVEGQVYNRSTVYYTMSDIGVSGTISAHNLTYSDAYLLGNTADASDDLAAYTVDLSGLGDCQNEYLKGAIVSCIGSDVNVGYQETNKPVSIGNIIPNAGKKPVGVKLQVSTDGTNYVETDVAVDDSSYSIFNQYLNYKVVKGNVYWEIVWFTTVLSPNGSSAEQTYTTTIPIASDFYLKPVITSQTWFMPLNLKVSSNNGSPVDMNSDSSFQTSYDEAAKVLTITKGDRYFKLSNVYKLGGVYNVMVNTAVGVKSNEADDKIALFGYASNNNSIFDNLIQAELDDWYKNVKVGADFVYNDCMVNIIDESTTSYTICFNVSNN